MKKLIRLIAWALVMGQNLTSTAQQVSIIGGLNLSNMVVSDKDEIYSEALKMNPGFNLGARLSFPLNRQFSIETGLVANTRGYRTSFEDNYFEDNFKARVNASLYYLDLPVAGKFTADLGRVKLHGQAGPYIGFGLSGKIKSKITFNGETEHHERKVQWGSEPYIDDVKRLDYGLLFGIGCSFESYQLAIMYGMGLANISPYTENGYVMSHRQLSLSLGYNITWD
jgi:hypothetical protein